MSLSVDPTRPATWGLDPTSHTCVKVLIRELDQIDVRGVGDDRGASAPYHLLALGGGTGRRPVQNVHITGLAVQIVKNRTLWRFLIDDGSGLASVLVWSTDIANVMLHSNPQDIRLGDTLSVQGRISIRYGSVDVFAQSISKAGNPHSELRWWAEIEQYRKELLGIR